MKDWRTTLCGIVFAAAQGIAQAPDGSVPASVKVVAQVVSLIASGLLGFFAADSKKG